MKLAIDFETRSRVDLKKRGVYVYAEDDSTEVLCLAYKLNESPVEIFDFLRPDLDCLQWLQDAFSITDEIHAHNAQFERLIYNNVLVKRYGFPEVPLEKWRCTAAKAAYYALPRSLDGACKALDLPVQKDSEGYKIMLKFCKPLPKGRKLAGQWYANSNDYEKLKAYCKQDVEAEYTLDQALFPVPEAEWEVWRADQRMNDRGIKLDLGSVNKIVDVLIAHEEALLAEMRMITGGVVDSPKQVSATLDYLRCCGLDLPDLQKRTVKDALVHAEGKAKRILEIRQSLSRSSTAKYRTMQKCACKDGRVRGLHLYHGASTGRWAGKLLQIQNFPRGSLNDDNYPLASEAGLFALLNFTRQQIVEDFGCVFSVASSVLRNMITAPNLLVGDYSQIEARVLAWLAGEQSVLDAFTSGKDLYKVAACDIFGISYENVVKHQRHVGKTAELALGYQGGIGAFANMAIQYGLDLEPMVGPVLESANEEEMELGTKLAEAYFKKHEDTELTTNQAVACDIVKQRWRKKRSNIASYWKTLEAAMFECVQAGEVRRVGRVAFGVRDKFLHIRLPSKRLLSYYAPEFKPIKAPWGDSKMVVTAMTVDPVSKKWVRRPYYGGLICENITQAVARDVLASAMLALDKAGYSLVMSVHDELVAEGSDLEDYTRIMGTTPEWAEGLPVEVDSWAGRRYRK